MLYLMRRMAIVVISRAVTIPKATETDADDEVTLPGDLDEDGERAEQRTSIDRMLGGGLIENRGGGGGSREQC